MSLEFDQRKEAELPIFYQVPGRWVMLEEPMEFEVELRGGQKVQRRITREFVPATEEELRDIKEAITLEDQEVMRAIMSNPPSDLIEAFGGTLLMFLGFDVLGHFRENNPQLKEIAKRTKGIGVWTNTMVSRDEANRLVSILEDS